ncbi:MAG: hypothetical protein ACPGJS_08230 [Flammeovirgaceae bacterium]
MYRILVLFLALTTFQAYGQNSATDTETDKEKVPLGERLYYSGGLDFNVTNQYLLLGVSPNVGYKFNEIFSMGLGATYQWFNFRLVEGSSHNFGGRVFARGKLPVNILLAAEYERVSFEDPFGIRSWRQAGLAGLGYHIPQNEVISLNIFLYYNLSYNQVDDLYGTEFVPRIEIAYNF